MREGGNRWEKPSFGASQSSLGASALRNDKFFPCSGLRLLLRSLVVAGLESFSSLPWVRHYRLLNSSRDVVGGCRLPISVTGTAPPVPMAPRSLEAP
jgi:hypothetical protein